MENEQSINNVLSAFERDQKKARVFNTAATIVGVIAAIGLIGLVVAIAYKYTSTEMALTGEVTQTRSELEKRLGELELTKTELTNQQMELTRLQETVKSGSASSEVITSLQRDLTANQQKLLNASDQITELKGLMTAMQNPGNEKIAILTNQLTEKEASLTALRNTVAEKDRTIAVKEKAIAERDKTIEILKKNTGGRGPGRDPKILAADPNVKIQEE